MTQATFRVHVDPDKCQGHNRCYSVAPEHSPPHRGVELRCSARLLTAGVEDAVTRIASRYLGLEAGAAYAGRAGDDLLVRLEPGDLRAWDLPGELS